MITGVNSINILHNFVLYGWKKKLDSKARHINELSFLSSGDCMCEFSHSLLETINSFKMQQQ